MLIVLPFENENGWESHRQHNFPTAEIFVIDGKNLFDESIKNDFKIYDNIEKMPRGQSDDYTIGCLLDYPNLKNY